MLRAEREVRKMSSTDKKQNGLQKSLALIFVYTVATGSIFTYVSYWDSCSSATAVPAHSWHSPS